MPYRLVWGVVVMFALFGCGGSSPAEPTPEPVIVQFEILDSIYSDEVCALTFQSSATGGPGRATFLYARLFAGGGSLDLGSDQVGWAEIRSGDVHGGAVSFGPASEGMGIMLRLVYEDHVVGVARQSEVDGAC